jgi:hypothetical protein
VARCSGPMVSVTRGVCYVYRPPHTVSRRLREKVHSLDDTTASGGQSRATLMMAGTGAGFDTPSGRAHRRSAPGPELWKHRSPSRRHCCGGKVRSALGLGFAGLFTTWPLRTLLGSA